MDKLTDTMTLQFKVKAEYKDIIFDDFKTGIISDVRRKWRRRKLKSPKTKPKTYLKGNNSLYFYFKGYDIFYKKPYPFTGNYGDYRLNYCHYKYRDDYILVGLRHNAIKNKSKDKLYENTLILLASIGIDTELLEVENKLNRIDYKHDFECEYKSVAEHQAIMNILSKTRDSYNGVYKEELKKGSGIKYKPQSSYTEIIIYDKEQERKDKLKKKKKTSHIELELKEFKNVFRTELRLKSKRLYYNKKHTLKMDKTLDNYYNEEVADECFKRYVEPIFYTEPFYRIDYALIAIQSDSRLTEAEAEKLCKLVIGINKNGYTATKDNYIYCDDTFDRHIKLLRSIGINPLTFDEDIELAILHNFTTKEVCRDYSLYDGLFISKKITYDEWGVEIS